MLTKEQEQLQSSFWEAVTMCLERIWHLDWSDANALVERHRAKLAASNSPEVALLVLHNEPFDVAGELAGKEIDREGFQEEYAAILGKAGL